MSSSFVLPDEFQVDDDLPLLKPDPRKPYINELVQWWACDREQRIAGYMHFLVDHGGTVDPSRDDPSAVDWANRMETVAVFVGDDIYYRVRRGTGTRPDGPGAVGAFATI